VIQALQAWAKLCRAYPSFIRAYGGAESKRAGCEINGKTLVWQIRAFGELFFESGDNNKGHGVNFRISDDSLRISSESHGVFGGR
jgi:hypothetical protein